MIKIMKKMIREKNKQEEKKEKSFGRSMVEMLGVLAVIGVLSVGGIAGYRMAINRYHANEIAQLASLLHQTAMSANGGTGITMAQAYEQLLPDIHKPAGLSMMFITKSGLIGIALEREYQAVAEVIDQIEGGRVHRGFPCSTTAIGSYCIINMNRSPSDEIVSEPDMLTIFKEVKGG